MSALSIRAKVIAVIAFMLIAMSGMGLLAIRSMQAINAHTVEIASEWLPSVRVLGELRADINLFRIALRAHVMAETLEAKAANDKRLAGILERIAKDRKAYEQLINSAEERSIYQSWASAWDKYITGVQDVIALSRGSIGRIPTEASEAISKKVAVIAAESDTFLEKGINLNNTGADTATRRGCRRLQFFILARVEHCRCCRHLRRRRRNVSGPRSLERDCFRREADAGAGKRGPDRRSHAPRREDRDRRHGGRAAGVQGCADRQEGR